MDAIASRAGIITEALISEEAIYPALHLKKLNTYLSPASTVIVTQN
jgi:hypothetical protein